MKSLKIWVEGEKEVGQLYVRLVNHQGHPEDILLEVIDHEGKDVSGLLLIDNESKCVLTFPEIQDKIGFKTDAYGNVVVDRIQHVYRQPQEIMLNATELMQKMMKAKEIHDQHCEDCSTEPTPGRTQCH